MVHVTFAKITQESSRDVLNSRRQTAQWSNQCYQISTDKTHFYLCTLHTVIWCNLCSVYYIYMYISYNTRDYSHKKEASTNVVGHRTHPDVAVFLQILGRDHCVEDQKYTMRHDGVVHSASLLFNHYNGSQCCCCCCCSQHMIIYRWCSPMLITLWYNYCTYTVVVHQLFTPPSCIYHFNDVTSQCVCPAVLRFN